MRAVAKRLEKGYDGVKEDGTGDTFEEKELQMPYFPILQEMLRSDIVMPFLFGLAASPCGLPRRLPPAAPRAFVPVSD